MKQIQEKNIPSYKISIAPMLDWTDRHFRFFLRQICKRPLFYSEMIASPALVLGNRPKLLDYSPEEHPLALQVGGSHPQMMAQCAQYGYDWGYQEININAGCPSSRVQAGAFGAVLMKTPEIVADCVAEMVAKVNIPITVKTRISLVDADGNGFNALFKFADLVQKAGCSHLIVHARQAKLNLSPKDNRGERLPLNYNVVYQLKKSFPDMPISINGNILNEDSIQQHLQFVDGVMIGRWAYGNPYALAQIDSLFYQDQHPILSRWEVLENMIPYLEKNQDKLSIICPHLMGLFHGQPNAKIYKQTLMNRNIDELKNFLRQNKE
ncbi:MAG: tRNA dihydrouridine(20/20a) synthase DusA [Alphaproteobacteria bacterium]|nr:tRNA dihydrouridine(20/20a) synthase DusA [Alphaproteobacteria bacterium]